MADVKMPFDHMETKYHTVYNFFYIVYNFLVLPVVSAYRLGETLSCNSVEREVRDEYRKRAKEKKSIPSEERRRGTKRR